MGSNCSWVVEENCKGCMLQNYNWLWEHTVKTAKCLFIMRATEMWQMFHWKAGAKITSCVQKCTRILKENSQDCKLVLHYKYYTTKLIQNCKNCEVYLHYPCYRTIDSQWKGVVTIVACSFTTCSAYLYRKIILKIAKCPFIIRATETPTLE
jgi:hypothetical protein